MQIFYEVLQTLLLHAINTEYRSVTNRISKLGMREIGMLNNTLVISVLLCYLYTCAAKYMA